MVKPVRYFRLTELGKQLFGWEKKNEEGRKFHWMKLPLDFFNHPAVIALPDSQRLALIGVGLLCVRRRVVLFDGRLVRRACSLRVAPDLDLYIAHGLIEIDEPSQTSVGLEERRGEEKEGEREEIPPPLAAPAPPPADIAPKATAEPVWVPPPDVRAEQAIRAKGVDTERRLLRAVALLSERLGRDPPGVMTEVTAYKKPDGFVVKGRMNPSGLSQERLQKSLEDAEAWLADLEKRASA
jgi:hypothetical protein